MFAMALNMFGLFEVTLPASLQNRLAAVGGIGVKGAFLIGFATGPIAAPCATAGLVGILDYVFRQRDAVGGGTALFFYSLGLGLPFWLVGALSLGLPKPGAWMDRVKSAMGIVLVVLGLYYLRHLVPVFGTPPRFVPSRPLLYAAMVVAGIGLGAVHLSFGEGSSSQRVRKVLGIVIASVGAAWLIAWEPPVPTIAWGTNAHGAAALARSSRRPVIVDFGATWCPACEELGHRTFTDPSVRREMTRFTAIKVDATESTPDIDAVQREHQVRGLPTVLVFDSSGREVVRVTEFVAAPRMVEMLRRIN